MLAESVQSAGLPSWLRACKARGIARLRLAGQSRLEYDGETTIQSWSSVSGAWRSASDLQQGLQ